MAIRDLQNQKFGKLRVMERDLAIKSRKVQWKCKCDCGNEKTIRSDSLLRGNTKSCGCLKRERDEINLRVNHSHKRSRTPLYSTWQHMKQRCYNSRNKAYQYYGARGIKICDEWKNKFNIFLEWALAHGYEENLSIDRIDVNGNYEPNNCRFTDMKGQCNNRRTNIKIEYKGCLLTLAQLSEKNNLDYGMLKSRYHRKGLRGEDLLKPSGYYRRSKKPGNA